ncbi:preprotein translocase subunit SecG [Fulvivirga maritima]|uniref:preprotein translocase subunit SecG n=1 Tax=Fulvivirga maritima TaxID=2904247 RepID=UPI001F17DBFD|nr:preprotein translocase subunit SecG [Fulvivirga maritima]UII25223.1 preprotein translocase subunit SecG [Fulvivirga maritima]
MITLVLSLIILASILLVLIILAQDSKGGGLTSQFGGAGASNMIGVKKTGDLLEKLTWGFAIAIIVLTLATNFLFTPAQGPIDEFRERANEQGAGSLPGQELLPAEEGQGTDAGSLEEIAPAEDSVE